MCGICGVFDLEARRTPEEQILRDMADTLVHRGPDDFGYHTAPGVGFGFRRLSIIDLEGGNQPLFNEDESIVMICNGEIYNYRELRDELKGKGHTFRTRCDVEVVPHLYEAEGPGFPARMNGQFGLAVYDDKKRELVLARDHVGITPLFYTEADGWLIFASEIKAILAHPAVRPEVNMRGLDQVLCFPGMVSPTTMFKGIHALKPGHILHVKDGKPGLKEYWDLEYPEASHEYPDQPESYWLDRLDEEMNKAVAYRLNADVPVGFYLSGGLDSSLIAALIHAQTPGTVRDSFSIGFTDAAIDERRFQQLMAEKVGSRHHETVFDWPDIAGRMQQAIYHSEAPLKESYNTCSLALSEGVRKQDLKVILTGEGADELFAGYVGYRFDKQRREQPADAYDLDSMMESDLRATLWGDADFFYEKNQYAFREMRQALYSEAANARFAEFDAVQPDLVNKARLQGRHDIHKRSYLDFKLRMSDHLISDHGDRVAYAHSVEARYPFLDVNVIRLAASMPPYLKLQGLTEKYLLKKLGERYLPPAITDREKFGFVAPGSPFLLQQNIEWVMDILSADRIKKQGYFNPDVIERLKKIYMAPDFRLNLPFDSDLLIVALTFGLFLELFKMPDFT